MNKKSKKKREDFEKSVDKLQSFTKDLFPVIEKHFRVFDSESLPILLYVFSAILVDNLSIYNKKIAISFWDLTYRGTRSKLLKRFKEDT